MVDFSAQTELERMLVGGILRSPDSLHQALAVGLRPSDLIDKHPSEALRSIVRLDRDQSPITPATIANVAQIPIQALEWWWEEGDPKQVRYLASQIRKSAARRELSQGLRRLAAQSETEDPARVLEQMRALAEVEVENSETQAIGDFVDAALDSIDPNKRATQVYTTGVPHLDRALGGGIQMHDEQLVIGADTGAGKTTLALGIAEHIASTYGTYPLFFSLEMTGQSVAAKLIGRVAGVPIRKSRYRPDEWARLTEAADWVRSLSIRLAVTTPTAESIEGVISSHVRQHGQTPVFVDYVQLMDSGERTAVDRIAEVSKVLRRTGRNLGVPIIALAQLNREGSKQQKQPTKHDFYGSGQIEKDCTVALLLWRPDPEEGEVRGVLDKRRFEPVEEVRRADGSMGQRIVSRRLSWAWHGSGQRFICGACEREPCECRG